MKEFIVLIRRFVPPYKWDVIQNFLYNLLGAVFGAFSFGLMIPALEILFKTKDIVTEKTTLEFSLESITANFNYYISRIMEKSGQERALIYIGIFIIITVLLKVGFTYLASFKMISIRNGVVRDIRSQIYHKILGLPLGYFTEEKKGDITSRMTSDVQEVENSIMNSLEMMFKNPVIIVISLGVMVYMSWSLTLFVVVMMPLAFFIIGRIGRSLKKQSTKGQAKLGEIMSVIDEDLTGLRVIKAFTAEKKASARFGKENRGYMLIMNRLMWRRHLAHPMSEFLGTIVMTIVLWYGGKLILNKEGSLSAAEFIGYLIFFYSIINPAKAFSQALYSVEKGLAAMNRIDKVLNSRSNIIEKPDAAAPLSFHKKIEYRNVSFAYNSTLVLKNISLEIDKGKTVALVGQSGGGKTTMVDLLPRFWDVSEGGIFIDGTDIRDIKMKNLRSLIGNVNQEPILFNDTIFNNIAFGVEDANPGDVVNAAKIANAHGFIMETENGYETVIGDRGDKLSGGQKQRISIARAILSNPPILILDEATSSLDSESEKLVQEALYNLMKNRTSLVIAHRLSTIKHADMICVIHKGKIVEQGTHEELLAKGGHYKKLHKMQMY